MTEFRAFDRKSPFSIWLPHSAVLRIPRPGSALRRIPYRIQPFLKGLHQDPTFQVTSPELRSQIQGMFRDRTTPNFDNSGSTEFGSPELHRTRIADRNCRGFLTQVRTDRGFPVEIHFLSLALSAPIQSTHTRKSVSLGYGDLGSVRPCGMHCLLSNVARWY